MKKITLFLFLILSITQTTWAQKKTSAIMQKAEKQAKQENKDVFLIFHASWCGWCKRMDAKMDTVSTKGYFDDHFVTTHVTVMESKAHKDLENPGGMKLMKKYHGAEAGLPFWVILDENGTMLTNSFDDSGANLGCPATKEEVAEFIKKLKSTTDISVREQQAVMQAFVLKR